MERLYETLLSAFGPQGWWPGEGPFETAVGAVLTQGTAWKNAALAVRNLRSAGAMSPGEVVRIGEERLLDLIRPAGFQSRKASTLKALSQRIIERGGDTVTFLSGPAESVRARLLDIHGIGDETADAILLYVAGVPTLIVDVYLRRVAERHGFLNGGESYQDAAAAFGEALPADASVLGEFHALIVELCKRYCRSTPACEGCPLNRRPFGQAEGL